MKEIIIMQLPVEDDRAFRNYDSVMSVHGKVTTDGYKEVWRGFLPEGFTPDDVFEMCNCRHPKGYAGHSMSVSDVVIMDGKHYFCDWIGWKEMEL